MREFLPVPLRPVPPYVGANPAPGIFLSNPAMSNSSSASSRRRSPWLIAGLLSGVLTGGTGAAPLNVVLILADDLGWADTTLYGHTKLYQTPNLERLARRGLMFTRAYSASPLCSPTRASILTGLSPARLGLTTPNCHLPQVVLQATAGKKAPPGSKAIPPEPVTRLNTAYQTLGETLKAAGYATGHFGKWHLGPEPYSPLQQGFEIDLPHTAGPGPAGSFVAPWKFKDFDPDPGIPDQHIEDRMAKEASAFMEKNRDRPFFLNYWMFSVHAPFDAKKSLIEKYQRLVKPGGPQRSPVYAAMVESMDDAVGTLLDTLDRLKLTEKTMIVFYSDNGGNMYNDVGGTTATSNAPLRGGKATVYEGGLRVPCVVSAPGITAPGSRSDAVIQSTDLSPTVLDCLQVPAPAGTAFDGISILPALKGRPLPREAIFTYFPHDPPVPDWVPPSVVVHQGDWKLMRLFFQGEGGAHRYQLFNLDQDLGERNNLAAQEPARVKQMDALIERFLVDHKVVRPVPNPAFDPAKYRPQEEGLNRTREGKAAKSPAKTAAAPAAPVDPGADPKLKGWRVRGGTVEVAGGIVKLSGNSPSTFLGYPAGGLEGPVVVEFHARAAAAGGGKLEWLRHPEAVADARSVAFQLPAGTWETVRLELPVEGPVGVLRLHLPAAEQPVELDWIQFKGGNGQRRMDF